PSRRPARGQQGLLMANLTKVRSIRTRLVLLVAFIALVVGGVSTFYDVVSSDKVFREQLGKRGRYIAANLAYNSKYGVLTEDKPLLAQLLDGAMSSVAGQDTDV